MIQLQFLLIIGRNQLQAVSNAASMPLSQLKLIVGIEICIRDNDAILYMLK